MVVIAGEQIGSIGYGLMGLTAGANAPPQDQAFKAMKTALERGANFWNGGMFYGTPDYNSLHLVRDYFTKYPEDADKVFLSIKGAFDISTGTPTGDEEGVRTSVEECLRVLNGTKKVDLFECGRVDPKVPIEVTVRALAKLIQEGKIGSIGLSECSADTIRRASAVHKIAGVEVEFSLFAQHIVENDVAKACAEFDIPILAYSPLGRGFLTDDLLNAGSIPENDRRMMMPRFHSENFKSNMAIAKEVQKVAKDKGCTLGQVALAWVMAKSAGAGMPTFIPIPGTKSASRVEENMTTVSLSNDEQKELDNIANNSVVHGDRYPEMFEHLSNGDSPLEK